ncbi:anhydro-N-acetylmuramic acid kinase [uncultured Endozoicomonas sp.]|uniref:anhydro-N-acetylmuramic acid kinase n=1 Tax=uncultured Endozoicomonas sp. TaxID=432652 RepID=UPI00261FDE66|nr:anhydro-N-acetylmuramic acid kinase [uncultured Endozoicomonas sp.]
MPDIYVGLMSGTSLDAMDAVAVEFDKDHPRVLATHSLPWPTELRAKIQQLCQPGDDEIRLMAEVDPAIARVAADAVNALLNKASLKPDQIQAIGSHGQTIRHMPELGYTLQIGDPNLLAELTNITVVGDFRRRDMAAGGQGAPLVPAFHHAIFTSDSDRVVVNIGGISNVSILPAGSRQVSGFDTGPGNLLMDYWCQKHWQTPFDEGGRHAAKAMFNPELLAALLSDPFFHQAPPKSTGRELFNPNWLESRLNDFSHLSPEVIQATLCSLTASCIADAIKQYAPDTTELFTCGGGAFNLTLMAMLQELLPNVVINSTNALGVDPQWVEAIAFAWLAKQRILNLPGNLPEVTGANNLRVLGGVYPA